MPLPKDEKLRPSRTVATKAGKKTKQVKFTDEEWEDFIEREKEHAKKEPERIKNEIMMKKEEEMRERVYSKFIEAYMSKEFDKVGKKMNELKKAREEINKKYKL